MSDQVHQPKTSIINKPVRMVQIMEFLSRAEHDALYDAVCDKRDLFTGPAGPGTEIDGSAFFSLESDEEAQAIRDAGSLLTKRIFDLLPDIFSGLGIDPFEVSRIPWSFIHGLNGHFGSPHADSIDGRFEISLLYYFHGTPKAFQGGDLEFYGTDPQAETGHTEKALFKVNNEDNLLIAFRSETFHGVTEVLCDSNDFEDGRIVATSFLGRK